MTMTKNEAMGMFVGLFVDDAMGTPTATFKSTGYGLRQSSWQICDSP